MAPLSPGSHPRGSLAASAAAGIRLVTVDRALVADLATTDRSAAVEVTAAFFARYVDDPDSFLDPSDTPEADVFLLRDEHLRAQFIECGEPTLTSSHLDCHAGR